MAVFNLSAFLPAASASAAVPSPMDGYGNLATQIAELHRVKGSMNENNSNSGRVQIILAIIATLSGWGVAAITNADKFFPSTDKGIHGEEKMQTCWRVEFGQGSMDWTMDLRVPSRAGCYSENMRTDSFEALALCDARFIGQNLKINMSKITVFRNGTSTPDDVVNMEAAGTKEDELISAMYITDGAEWPWRANRIDCRELIR